MARVYLWMTGGLLITAVVAAGVAGSDELVFTLTGIRCCSGESY